MVKVFLVVLALVASSSFAHARRDCFDNDGRHYCQPFFTGVHVKHVKRVKRVKRVKHVRKAEPRVAGRFIKRSHVNMSCTPSALRRMLNDVGAAFNSSAVVSSAYRSRAHNRRVGGARHSQHIACRAVDFKVAGVSSRRVFQWVKSNRRAYGIHGLGYYGARGHIHVDVRRGDRLVMW